MEALVEGFAASGDLSVDQADCDALDAWAAACPNVEVAGTRAR
ncbi:hypothetical protein ACIGQE_21805 [Streptomyces sp. NPDC053429]